jgi:hypothetical protein
MPLPAVLVRCAFFPSARLAHANAGERQAKAIAHAAGLGQAGGCSKHSGKPQGIPGNSTMKCFSPLAAKKLPLA